jgi:hypothetical protein
MKVRQVLLAAGLALAVTGPVAAEPEPAASVSGVTVTAQTPCTVEAEDGQAKTTPYVVETYPTGGSVIRPGLLFLRVSFSEPMSRCAVGFVGLRVGPPKLVILADMQSPDRRTFLYLAKAPPNTHFDLFFAPHIYGNEHLSKYGVAPKTHELVFSTSGSAPLSTVRDALKAVPHIEQILNEPGDFAEVGAHHQIALDLRSLYQDSDAPAPTADTGAQRPQGATASDPSLADHH